MQIARSLHQLGSSLVNSYLVEDGGFVTVVDAGLPGYWRLLPDELAAMGRSLDDVRALVLTHGDTDHVGFAARLHRERGVDVYVHELDAGRVLGKAKKPGGAWGRMRPGATLRFLSYAAWNGGFRVRPVAEVREFRDEATLDVPGLPRVISLPGHTPGSVAFHVASVDALFVGDALTTRSVLTGEAGPQPAPFTADPKVAAESLARIEAVQARWVLPGHGEPWSGGVPEAIRRYREAAAGR